MVCDLLDTTGPPRGSPLARYLPPTADLMLSGQFASLPLSHKKGASGFLTTAVSRRRRTHLIQGISNNPGLSSADRTHLLAGRLRSQTSRIFTANLLDKHNRIPAEAFTPFLRWWLNLPRLSAIGPHTTPIPNSDVRGEVCRANHPTTGIINTTLDHFCAATTGAYSALHHRIRNLVVHHATRIGFFAGEDGGDLGFGKACEDMSLHSWFAGCEKSNTGGMVDH